MATHDTEPVSASRLLDIDGVRGKVGGSRPVDASTVYRLIQQGRLPKPVKIGARISRWIEHEIDAAIQRRADARSEAGPSDEVRELRPNPRRSC
jgi:predicted DNA-binding transcriptional regulator AlpA